MITKTAQELLAKEAGAYGNLGRGWRDLPSNLKWVYDFLTPAKRYGYEKTKNTASAIRKGFDAGVRGLDYVSKQVVENPLPTIPLVAGVGLGAYNFSKNRAANSARIEDPDSGVTRIRPFSGRIEFTNPMYQQYF